MPLRIAHLGSIDSAPLLIARQLGFFAEEGLDVQLRRELGFAALTAKLAERQLDGACLPAHAHVLLSLGAGLPRIAMSAAAICSYEDLAIVLATKNPVRPGPSPTESPTLKIGLLTPGTPARLLVQRWLQVDFHHARIEPVFVPLAAGQLVDFLGEGVIDGFCGLEPAPTLAAANRSGEIVARSGTLQPGHPGGVLALPREYAQKNPAVLKSLDRAVTRARQFCANPANAAEVWKSLGTPSGATRLAGGGRGPDIFAEKPHEFPAPAPWFQSRSTEAEPLLDAAGVEFVSQACLAAGSDLGRGADLKAEIARVFRLPVAAPARVR